MVVGYRAIDKVASVEPFLSMRVEADPDRGSGEKSDNAADSCKEFTIDDGVDSDPAELYQN